MRPDEYDNANEWAVYVSRDEPHSLADLQHQVQILAPKVIERAAQPWGKRIRHGIYMLVSVLSFIGPIAAVTVFLNLSHAYTRAYDFDPGFEFTVAVIGFCFGIFFEARMMYRWWHEGRYRDAAAISLSVIILACALGTIAQAYAGVGFTQAEITLAMLPAFITALTCIVMIGLSATAPPKPADVIAAEKRAAMDEKTGEEQKAGDIDLSALTGDARAAVLKDRNHALGALDVRGLLKGHDVVELRKRPLGSLVQDGEEQE